MEVPTRSEHLPQTARDQPTVRKRRACEPCRSLKARCLFENPDLAQCTNCIKCKRRCVIGDDRRYPRLSESTEGAGPQLRNIGSSMLGGSRASEGMPQDGSVPSDSEAFGGLFPFLFSDISIDSTRAHGSERAPTPPDAIDRGVLDLETASDAFKYFITKIAQRLPIVAFHQNISVVQCRSSTPVLFLAILIAASGKYQSNLQATLLDEFHKIIADQVVYQGQKRLELVQGILISLFWIPPPDRLEDMKFGMMAHLAASMIQDLRLKSARYHPMGDRGSRQKILGQSSVNGDESTTIEGHRTLLGCYCACAMLSLVLRRATILPFNDIMSQSLDTIRESPEALPTDKMLVAWVELQRISVDLTEVKNATPNPATSPTSENMKVWLCRTFESRLLNWKESTSVDIQEQEILMIEYHTLMLHANLLGISDGRTPIAPPFTVDMISPKFPITNLPAFGKCIASAQAVLESCIRIPPAEIPSIPGIMFPRVVHALLILIVAASAILGSAHGESNLQSTLRAKDVSDLAISEYIDRIVDMFRKSPGPVRGRATKAVTILTLLKIWYAKNILHDTEDSSGSQPLASATHQGRATTNAPGTEPGILMDMENFPTPNNTQSTNFFLGSLSNDFPAPNLLNIDAMLESGQPLPLREEQYAFFESLVEGPGGPPWTLFDDAMDVFDWM